MKYISIDIETTGLDEKVCQILEFAAVFDDLDLRVPPCDYFHCYVKPKYGEYYTGDLVGLHMNAHTLAAIVKNEHQNVVDHMDVIPQFVEWLRGLGLDKINIAGKNFVTFDLRFLKDMYGWETVKWHKRIIDPAILFFENEDEVLPDMAQCLVRAGIQTNVKHNALEDAMTVIDLVRKGLCM